MVRIEVNSEIDISNNAVRALSSVISYQHKLIKMRAELTMLFKLRAELTMLFKLRRGQFGMGLYYNQYLSHEYKI